MKITQMKMKKVLVALASSAMLLTALVPAASAHGMEVGGGGHGWFVWPAAVGNVLTVSGNSITITGKNSTVYTIDATNADIMKDGATATISNITVGDTIVIFGSINGTAITATGVLDGLGKSFVDKVKNNFFGVVTAINGTNFTLQMKNKDNTTKDVTVNASAATFLKTDGSAGTIADLKVNDTVRVKGTLDAAGTTVTATKVKIGAVDNGKHKGHAFGHFKGVHN